MTIETTVSVRTWSKKLKYRVIQVGNISPYRPSRKVVKWQGHDVNLLDAQYPRLHDPSRDPLRQVEHRFEARLKKGTWVPCDDPRSYSKEDHARL